MPEQFAPAWEYFCPSEEIDEQLPRDFSFIFDGCRGDHAASPAERRASLGFRFGKGNPDKFLPFRLGRPKPGRVIRQLETKQCRHCGATFTPRRKQRTYCGRSCARKHEWAWWRTTNPKAQKEPKKRKSRIDPTIFAEMFLAGCRMKDIAGRFGVQINQCKKLRRKLGLPGRPHGRPSRN